MTLHRLRRLTLSSLCIPISKGQTRGAWGAEPRDSPSHKARGCLVARDIVFFTDGRKRAKPRWNPLSAKNERNRGLPRFSGREKADGLDAGSHSGEGQENGAAHGLSEDFRRVEDAEQEGLFQLRTGLCIRASGENFVVVYPAFSVYVGLHHKRVAASATPSAGSGEV